MRGNITRRGKASWRPVRRRAGRINRQTSDQIVTVKGKRADAEAELARLLNDAHRGTLIDASRLTVKAYLWPGSMGNMAPRR